MSTPDGSTRLSMEVIVTFATFSSHSDREKERVRMCVCVRVHVSVCLPACVWTNVYLQYLGAHHTKSYMKPTAGQTIKEIL